MKKHPIAALEVLNRRRLARRNFLTDYLGGNEQNRRKEVSDLASMEYLSRRKCKVTGQTAPTFAAFFHAFGRYYEGDPMTMEEFKAFNTADLP